MYMLHVHSYVMAISGSADAGLLARSVLRVHNIQCVVLDCDASEHVIAASDALRRCGLALLPVDCSLEQLQSPTLAMVQGCSSQKWHSLGAWELRLPDDGMEAMLLCPSNGKDAPNSVSVGHSEPLASLQDAVQALLWAGEARAPSILDPSTVAFGPHALHIPTQVFLEEALCYATVNRRPVVRGHVLVVPRRPAVRLSQLTSAEAGALWAMVHRVQHALELHLGTSGATIVVQDGASAGQTVPHVHVHILPRSSGDLAAASGGVCQDGDEVYDMLKASKQGAGAPTAVPCDEEVLQLPEGHGTALDREGGQAALVSVDEGATAAAEAAAEASGTPHHRKKRVWIVKVRGPKAMAAEAAEYRPLFGAPSTAVVG